MATKSQTLGPDYEQAIADIIDERMQLLHDGHTNSEKNILEFLSVERHMRSEYWARIIKAEKFLTRYRAETRNPITGNPLQPFNWSLESVSSVNAMLGLDAGKSRIARTIEHKQAIVMRQHLQKQWEPESTARAVREGDISMFRRVNKLKPEYQGANYPLEQSQVKRAL